MVLKSFLVCFSGLLLLGVVSRLVRRVIEFSKFRRKGEYKGVAFSRADSSFGMFGIVGRIFLFL